MRRSVWSLSLIAVIVLCGALPALYGQSPESSAQPGKPIHIVPKVMNPQLAAPPAGALLQYYGGPVTTNLQVIVVFWGPNVNSTVTSNIGAFYTAITNSNYFDMLGEYNTNITVQAGTNVGQAGTNQIIGPGTNGGTFTNTPSVCSTGPCTVADTKVQSEIKTQITNGNLPAPTSDSAGNNNTLYMIYFPPKVKITQGG